MNKTAHQLGSPAQLGQLPFSLQKPNHSPPRLNARLNVVPLCSRWRTHEINTKMALKVWPVFQLTNTKQCWASQFDYAALESLCVCVISHFDGGGSSKSSNCSGNGCSAQASQRASQPAQPVARRAHLCMCELADSAANGRLNACRPHTMVLIAERGPAYECTAHELAERPRQTVHIVR